MEARVLPAASGGCCSLAGAAGSLAGRADPQPDALRVAGALAEAACLRRPWWRHKKSRAPELSRLDRRRAGELPHPRRCHRRIARCGCRRGLGAAIPAAAFPRRHGAAADLAGGQSLGLVRIAVAGICRAPVAGRRPPARPDRRFSDRWPCDIARNTLHRAFPHHGGGLRACRRHAGYLRDLHRARHRACRPLSAGGGMARPCHPPAAARILDADSETRSRHRHGRHGALAALCARGTSGADAPALSAARRSLS